MGSIHPLTKEHVEACALLYMDIFNAAPWFDHWTPETTSVRMTEIFQHPQFFGIGLFSVEQQLIGFILGYSEQWWDSRHFHLYEMGIKQEYQGSGWGRKLLQTLEKECRNKGIQRIYLFTARNGQAEQFYTNSGFLMSPYMGMMSKIIK